MDPVAKTSLYTAVLRARESARPDRLFSDPFAEALAGPQGDDLLAWMEVRSPVFRATPSSPSGPGSSTTRSSASWVNPK